jgi:hypothetical protein
MICTKKKKLTSWLLGPRSQCSDGAILSSIPGRRTRFFFSLKGTDRLWGPPYLLFNRCHGILPGGNEAGAWSPASNAQVKNEWRCTSTPSIHRRAVYKDNFVITLLLIYYIKAPTTLTRARKYARQVPSPVAVNSKHVVRFDFQKSLTSWLTHLRASRSSRTIHVSPSWLSPSSPNVAPARFIFAQQSKKYNINWPRLVPDRADIR